MDLPASERWISIDTAALLISKRHMTPLSGQWWTGIDLARNLLEWRLASGLLKARPKDFHEYFLCFKGTLADGREVDQTSTLKTSSDPIPRIFWTHFRDAKRLSRGYPQRRLVRQGDYMVPVEDFDSSLPHARERDGNFSFLQNEQQLIDGLVIGEAKSVLVDSHSLIHKKQRGRKPGKKYDDVEFLPEMELLIRSENLSIRAAAGRIVERYGSEFPGDGTIASKVDRLRANFSAWVDEHGDGILNIP